MWRKPMFYCEDCKLANNENKCFNCSKKNLPEIKSNNAVYLTSKDAIWSATLEDILDRNEIPFIKNGTQGAGITSEIGFGGEYYHFYVPYGAYEEAKEIVDSIFFKD